METQRRQKCMPSLICDNFIAKVNEKVHENLTFIIILEISNKFRKSFSEYYTQDHNKKTRLSEIWCLLCIKTANQEQKRLT